MEDPALLRERREEGCYGDRHGRPHCPVHRAESPPRGGRGSPAARLCAAGLGIDCLLACRSKGCPAGRRRLPDSAACSRCGDLLLSASQGGHRRANRCQRSLTRWLAFTVKTESPSGWLLNCATSDTRLLRLSYTVARALRMKSIS